jgi:hypothetical protein
LAVDLMSRALREIALKADRFRPPYAQPPPQITISQPARARTEKHADVAFGLKVLL